MMHTWFLASVRYDKTLENGMQKKVTELYLVDALSFTEAEARIIQEITPFISGEFEIANIKKAKINEMFLDETGDRWYKCKVNFITLDDKSGMEKKTASNMMVQASDLAKALEGLTQGMLGTLADYDIASITETQIMDVFPWTGEEDERTKVDVINYNGKEIEASVSSIEMLGALLKAKRIVSALGKDDPERLNHYKECIKTESKNKRGKYLSSAISLAKGNWSETDVIWILGTAALMLEEYGTKEGGEDVSE